MDRCRAICYTGSVQGVGFRFTARGLAQRFAVTGYVRNLSDGRVELMVAGDEEEVEGYLAAVRESMGDYIAAEETSWVDAPERFVTFDIRF
jgi:acylphosphatase